MKINWSYFTISLVLIFLISLIVANGREDAPKNKENETNGSNEEVGKINIINGKISPPVTITTILSELPNTYFRDGESLTDNVHTRWAKEQLGVNFEVLWYSSRIDQSYEERLKLILATGQELPDVFVSLDDQLIEMLIESGLVMDVGEAFEKYASKTYKAAMAEVSPKAWWPFNHEGKKYAIPIIHEYQGSQPVMWIRQDWLDTLGLEAPTNIEELEALMDAFATQDPDGNDKNDTIPLALTAKPDFTKNPVGNSSWVFGLFGVIPERWYPGTDGKLTYGSVQPQMKDALIKIRDWKEKGYIFNQVALNDFNSVSVDIKSNKVGIVGAPYWLNHYSSWLLKSNPSAIYNPYPLPEGVGGKNMRTVDNPSLGGIFINKDISEEALKALFHYQNTLYSIYESENPFLFKDFQEGYDYVIQDGQAITSNEVIPGGRTLTMKYMLTASAPIYNSRNVEANLKHARGEELTTRDLSALAAKADLGMGQLELLSRQAMLVAIEQEYADVPEYFHGLTTPTMERRWEMLKKMERETFIDIIYGEKPVEAFDAFVESWYSNGGEDVTKEVNEWYDSVK
ncbi:type 2 periplasmic-binding domain-containing protein [Litchfieldia salsa]|uniref:Putative aldouronate transport system substrate-binding protein n=1 Tax=Litchfieldia salsa TaxID=930152 RepID=A0A1H0VLA1_9BACI|nr:extracellular solute-binding protein [Litchfieldia salsa]SDP79369.1 putative aldouronate transport system substrate-binding protein [Litchfieldia salsa]